MQTELLKLFEKDFLKTAYILSCILEMLTPNEDNGCGEVRVVPSVY